MEGASSWVDLNYDEEDEVDFDETDSLTPQLPNQNAFGIPQPANTSFSFSAPQQNQSAFGGFGQPPQQNQGLFGAPPQNQNVHFGGQSSSFGFGGVPQNVNAPPQASYPFNQQQNQYQQQYSPQNPFTAKRKQRFRKANTNVLAIKLGTLTEDVVLSTGDPCFCNCGAAYSHLDVKSKETDEMETDEESTTTTTKNLDESDSQKWTCNFCNKTNDLTLDEEEIPKEGSVDYILEPPTEKSSDNSDSKTLIFCIDISGSMCVSTEVVGKHSLKGNESIKRLASLNTEGADQWIPNQRRDVTYISRLQSVKAAVDAQLETMAKDQPNRRIGLITFNSEVTVIGDGISDPVIITGDKLQDFDSLITLGKQQKLARTIKDTKSQLSKKLFDLEESGPTALGPALVTAVGMASEVRGSEIVICTDGLANIGIGNMEDLKSDEDIKNAKSFYERIGLYAAENGVSVSVISIEGTDCKLENLGIVADASNGEVNIVSPLKIISEFQSILSLPVIATNCSIKLLLHNGMFIRSDDSLTKVADKIDNSKKESVFVKDFGNVTSESGFTLEYGVKNKNEMTKENLKRSTLPFQLQIRYTKLNGMKCIRIISNEQKVTWDTAQAEQAAKVDILGMNAIQTSAKIAQGGSYTSARFHNMANMDLIQRASSITNQTDAMTTWGQRGAELEEQLQTVQLQEQSEGLYLDMDDDTTDESKEKRKNTRGARRNDKTANFLWNATSHRKGFK